MNSITITSLEILSDLKKDLKRYLGEEDIFLLRAFFSGYYWSLELGNLYDTYKHQKENATPFSTYLKRRYGTPMAKSTYSVIALISLNNQIAVNRYLEELESFESTAGKTVCVITPLLERQSSVQELLKFIEQRKENLFQETTVGAIKAFINGIDYGYRKVYNESFFEPWLNEFEQWLNSKHLKRIPDSYNWDRILLYLCTGTNVQQQAFELFFEQVGKFEAEKTINDAAGIDPKTDR